MVCAHSRKVRPFEEKLNKTKIRSIVKRKHARRKVLLFPFISGNFLSSGVLICLSEVLSFPAFSFLKPDTTPSQAVQIFVRFAKPMKEIIRHFLRLNLYLIGEVWPYSWMVAFYGTNFSIVAIGMFYLIDFRRLF